jgi:hypothetical protein
MHKRKSDGSIFYVGAGKGSRCRAKCGRSKFWLATVAKHGLDVEILKPCLSFDESRAFEIETIKLMREQGVRLCNMTDGGEGLNGLKHRQETKAKISANNIGKNTGKKWSEEARAKIIKARTGKVRSQETRDRISASQKGRPKNKPPVNKGIPMPEAQRLKLVGLPKSLECIEKIRAKAVARWADIAPGDRPKVDNSGLSNPRADKAEYLFVHDDGRWIRSTRVSFFEETGVRPNKLFGHSPSISVHGWRRYCS